jgi:dynein heavy chain
MGPRAEKLINTAMVEGHWVTLQNCHLARSWMGNLELIVLDFPEKKDEIHEDFRLFLTSMPAPYFPTSVLQNSVKLTTEPPRGMRANMMRTYQNYSQEILDNEHKPQIWRKLLFCFAFFHAVVQERRKFGPLGWNIRYEFNDSDLETTNTMLKLFLESQDEIPWDALLFVTGDINYGGRVTDDLDRRCLLSILKLYCSPEALKDDYKFSPSGLYYAPADGKIELYRDYIEGFPLNADPEVFGMHGNANISYESLESNKIIETILSIQPRVAGGGGGLTPDQIVLEKSKDFLEQLPELLEQANGQKELFIKNSEGLIPSFSTVLVQEMEKFNRLLICMKKTLIDIDLAINGFIVMSETLDEMYLKFTNNQVPNSWTKVGYLSLKPLSSWFRDLLLRVEFMRNWLENGNPMCYWFSAFFFPHGFMTGILQTHARRYSIAIDKLSFGFEIMQAEAAEHIEDYPDEGVGVYISGLFMDGARWDRDQQVIADQFPAKMTETMPVVWFIPK